MAIFDKLANSWTLAKECWEVLMHDKEMLVYPLLTTVVSVAILTTAYFYLLGAGFFGNEIYLEYSNQQWIIGSAIVLATLYCCHFSYSFFEAALVASAIKRLRGDNPTVLYGLGIASDRIPQIAGWAFFSTLFGIFLMVLKSIFKNSWSQKIIGGITETAWNVVTIFVLPVFVVENVGSMTSIKKSAALVKSKWGEAATLEIGFGVLCSIASTPIAGLFILAGFLHAASPEISIALMGVGIGLAVLLGLVFSALNGIAKAVLYNFALDGDLPREIHNSTLDGLVVQRRDDENSAPGRIQT